MTITKTECVLLSSLMDAPTNRPGPVTCTAIAFAEYWESPEAQQVALAVREVMKANRPLHRAVIKQFLTPEYQPWLEHKMFNDGLPHGIAEFEAKEVLLPWYESKRLVALLGEAYESAIRKPWLARVIAMGLKARLEEML